MRVAILTTDNREHQRTYHEPHPRFGPAIESVLDGLSSQSDLEIHVVSCSQRPMAAPEKLSENTRFHLLEVPKIGWLRTGYQGCVRAIRRKLREIKPDLVHGEGTERECALSAALSDFPNVVTIHGNMGEVAKAVHAPVGSFLWCAARVESYALRRAGGVLCNSAYTESVVRRFNQRTWRVPNALRRPFFETQLSPRSTTGRPILLNVGVIAPFKGQTRLLSWGEELHRRGLPFEMRFIGQANEESRYASMFLDLLKKAQTAGWARHQDPVTMKELIKSFDGADALIHLASEEAFGLVVAEALARNLKLFGLEIGGVADIGAGIEGAELFTPGNEVAMIDAIEKWIQNGAGKPKDAASKIRMRYHPDVIAQRHLEVYHEAINGRVRNA